jgi:hypothetical protein
VSLHHKLTKRLVTVGILAIGVFVLVEAEPVRGFSGCDYSRSLFCHGFCYDKGLYVGCESEGDGFWCYCGSTPDAYPIGQ